MGKRSRAPTWNRESESAQRRHRWGWVPCTFQGEFRKVWRRHFKAQGSLRCVAWGRSPVYPGLRIVLLQTKRRERILLGNANGQEPQGAILSLRCRQGVAGENGFWELFDVPFVAWDSPAWSPASPGASTWRDHKEGTNSCCLDEALGPLSLRPATYKRMWKTCKNGSKDLSSGK